MWDRVLESQCDQALESAKQIFQEMMNASIAEKSSEYDIFEHVGGITHFIILCAVPVMVNQVLRVRPLEDAELAAVYETARKAGEKEFAREDVTAYSSIETYLLQLSEYTLDFLQSKYSENDAASVAYNKGLLEELAKATADPLDDPLSVSGDGARYLQDQLTASRDRLDAIVTQYKVHALGPSRTSVLSSFLTDELVACMLEWGALVKKAFRSREAKMVGEIASTQQRLRSIEAKVRAAQEMLVQQKDAYERALQSIAERITAERSALGDGIEAKQAEIDRTHLQAERLSALHKEALDRLDVQIQEAKDERKRLEVEVRDEEARRESERQEAQRQLLESERNFHNEEKGLLQGQQQFLRKVLELERQLGEQDAAQIEELYRIEKENQAEISQLTLKLRDEQDELKEGAIRVRTVGLLISTVLVRELIRFLCRISET